MPKFDAASVVEPLDWDFTKFVDGAKGITPEPNEKLLAEFIRDVANLTSDVAKERKGLSEDASIEDVVAAVAELRTCDILEEMYERMSHIYAAVCQDSPNFDQLQGLPIRHRSAFYTYMAKELRPEVFGVGMSATQSSPRA